MRKTRLVSLSVLWYQIAKVFSQALSFNFIVRLQLSVALVDVKEESMCSGLSVYRLV